MKKSGVFFGALILVFSINEFCFAQLVMDGPSRPPPSAIAEVIHYYDHHANHYHGDITTSYPDDKGTFLDDLKKTSPNLDCDQSLISDLSNIVKDPEILKLVNQSVQKTYGSQNCQTPRLVFQTINTFDGEHSKKLILRCLGSNVKDAPLIGEIMARKPSDNMKEVSPYHDMPDSVSSVLSFITRSKHACTFQLKNFSYVNWNAIGWGVAASNDGEFAGSHYTVDQFTDMKHANCKLTKEMVEISLKQFDFNFNEKKNIDRVNEEYKRADDDQALKIQQAQTKKTQDDLKSVQKALNLK